MIRITLVAKDLLHTQFTINQTTVVTCLLNLILFYNMVADIEDVIIIKSTP
jgi:hypothetical protein